MKPTITTFSNYQQLSAAVSKKIITRLKHAESLVLGPATGFSSKLAYELIAEQLAINPLLASKISMVQLDEWSGISPNDEASCYYRIKKQMVFAWKLNEEQCFLLAGDRNQDMQMQKMKSILEARPMDFCILGLGKNGHIALNEPGSTLDSTCRSVVLSNSSKRNKMAQNPEIYVEKGITIGLKEILESKEVLLLVTGEGKQDAFQKLLNKAPVQEFPASALYEHPNWECYVDQSAVDYFSWRKPRFIKNR